MRVFLLTAFALTAFAFNSILCRWALGSEAVDAASFTFVRILTGVAALLAILSFRTVNRSRKPKGSALSGFFLFAYAVFFSFAYNDLATATGALILFGAVQITMFGFAVFSGEKPTVFEWVGLVVSFVGLIYLVSPGLEAPPLIGAGLMSVSGICWGAYTLRGKGVEDPLAETAGNFVWALPVALLVLLVSLANVTISPFGIAMASISGAVTSGVGYAVWYSVLKDHSSARAAVLQLSVPLIAAFGGVLLVGEELSLRLLLAGALILGGILVAIYARSK